MKKSVKASFCFALSLIFVFLCVGYAQLTDTLIVSGQVDLSTNKGIYITGVAVPEGADATVDSFISTILTSTMNLGTNGDCTVTLSVTFFNNSDKTYMYDSVTYESEAYTNDSIVFDVSYVRIILHRTALLHLILHFHIRTALPRLYPNSIPC